MFFTIDDVIELKEKDYLVEDVTLIDNDAYYKVIEVDKKTDDKKGKSLILIASKDEEKLYVEEVKDNTLIEKVMKNLKN